MIIKDVFYLLILIVLPILIYWRVKKEKRPTWIFSKVSRLTSLPKSWRVRVLGLPFLLQLLAIFLLVLVLTRPQKGDERSQVIREGIAIMMLLDKSSSMSQVDLEYRGQLLPRFEVAKAAFRKFVMGGGDMSGRSQDLVGMLSFARWADTHSPLTLDHQMIDGMLQDLATVTERAEDGTAIGAALAAACENLKRSDSFANKPRSRIVVLLTDGQDSGFEGAISPKEATHLAQSLGIKIYTIGVAPEVATSSGRLGSFFGRRGNEVDESLLKSIADVTGGKYFRATDADALVKVMKNINELEKSKIEDLRYSRYSEVYLPFLLAAMTLLQLSYFLSNSILKRGP